LGLGASLSSSLAASYEASILIPPKPNREFRAAWVATVGNIDWPSTTDLTTAQQKAELLSILDRAVQFKLNAIIFQVRPSCDAMYASSLEPWSEYLTGTMGKPPQPFYDPLAFITEEAHRRGLELHAWFNPYRARVLGTKSPASPLHVSKARPRLVRPYGKYLWLDPGDREVQDYSLNVVMDVVRRYDIDGVHFDDYFYPYKENDASGKELDFPDAASWSRSGAGGKLSREDWRRENVNIFIQKVYRAIKSAKPWVKFGVSPFGIWRPGYPPQIQGYDAYAKLYADSRKWLASGWLDYFAPQLYWAIDSPGQSYPVLLKWWAAQNVAGRHLWPGLNSVNTARAWKPEEILNQIRLTRQQPGATGHIHWDMRKALMRGNALPDALERGPYSSAALVPASPWLSTTRPPKPRVTVAGLSRQLAVSWRLATPGEAWLWLLQTRRGGQWTTQILPAGKTAHRFSGAPPEAIALTTVDRFGNASSPTVFQLRTR
jgi:uncharacterized lipoprotein YddW (UPF0748 family)